MRGVRQPCRGFAHPAPTEEDADPLVDLPVATIDAALGQKDEAFERLERAYRRRDRDLLTLATSPWFDGLRSDQRYRDLVRRIGFPEATARGLSQESGGQTLIVGRWKRLPPATCRAKVRRNSIAGKTAPWRSIRSARARKRGQASSAATAPAAPTA